MYRKLLIALTTIVSLFAIHVPLSASALPDSSLAKAGIYATVMSLSALKLWARRNQIINVPQLKALSRNLYTNLCKSKNTLQKANDKANNVINTVTNTLGQEPQKNTINVILDTIRTNFKKIVQTKNITTPDWMALVGCCVGTGLTIKEVIHYCQNR